MLHQARTVNLGSRAARNPFLTPDHPTKPGVYPAHKYRSPGTVPRIENSAVLAVPQKEQCPSRETNTPVGPICSPDQCVDTTGSSCRPVQVICGCFVLYMLFFGVSVGSRQHLTAAKPWWGYHALFPGRGQLGVLLSVSAATWGDRSGLRYLEVEVRNPQFLCGFRRWSVEVDLCILAVAIIRFPTVRHTMGPEDI